MTPDPQHRRALWQILLLAAGFLVLVAIGAASVLLVGKTHDANAGVVHTIEVENQTRPYHIVAIHAKIWTADGMEIVMLAAPKKLIESCGRPVANIWCTHTPKPMKPVATVESATQVWPTIGRRLNTGKIIESIPVAGRNRM